MTGLLGDAAKPRTCPHDKSALSRIDGSWKIDQVHQAINKSTSNYEWMPTGYMFTANLYRCAVCGYVEMVDQP